METKMKMLIVCPCGTLLKVSMAQYLQMRCPKCQQMLAEEIERQASRNAKIVRDVTAIILHERFTSKRWTIRDEAVARILAQHETESHGGTWPPPPPDDEEDILIKMPSAAAHANASGHTDVTVEQQHPHRKMKVKIKKKTKKGRR